MLIEAALLCGTSPCWAQQLQACVALNQLGFLPCGPKRAALSRCQQDSFFVRERVSADTVWRGRLGPARFDSLSGLRIRMAAFSGLRKAGAYELVSGPLHSGTFRIGQEVYSPLLRAGVKAYYYQRAGTALPARYAGRWARAEGTPDTLVYVHPSAAGPGRPAFSTLSAAGGWYDAGDYNEYIVNCGITMGTLLSAWEDYGTLLDTLHTNIPEPDPGVPEYLEELLYNLRWMLKMQDPADGGVYHKLSEARFAGMILPKDDTLRRYVLEKSTAATLDFAAVMAQAARVLGPWQSRLPGLADSCRTAALKAWHWARIHPDRIYDQDALNRRYAPAITTGSYSDSHLRDEASWAASELYISTRNPRLLAFLPGIGDTLKLPSWSQVECLGIFSLLRHRRELPLQPYLDRLQDRLLRFGRSLIKGYSLRAFRTVMGARPQDFVWGSNAVAANEGWVLLECYRYSREPAFWYGALSNLDYLLGRNATGYCFVTGFGWKSPLHPHHRPSVAERMNPPVPGFLVGGPNPGQQDGSPDYPSRMPALSYVDDARAYACNEVAINWNAPLVYLLSGISSTPGLSDSR